MSFKGEIGKVVETGRGDGEISSFEWRIPGFHSLAGEGGDDYDSPSFDACDGRWLFEIYPKGLWRDSPSNWVSIYLYRLDEGPPQTLDVTLGIRGPEGVKNRRGRRQEFSDDDTACFWCDFCSRSHLTEEKSVLMPGNVLILSLDMKSVVPRVARDSSTQTVEESKEAEVSAEGNLTSEKQDSSTQTVEESKEAEASTEENHSSEKQGVEELQKSFQRLLACEEDSDVVIKVRGKEFRAHRAILRARSSVLQAMFTHDMVEKQSGKVNMEDCDPESFSAFLDHIYTGSTRMISTENVFSLYAASDKYDLRALKEACTEFVKHNLTVSCFCDAITLAVKHDEKELINLATEFFCGNSLAICKTVEWQIFLKENSTVANELLIKAFSKYVAY